jgi:PAS domain S-box-containing protein
MTELPAATSSTPSRPRGGWLSFQRQALLAFAASLVLSVAVVTAFLYVRLRDTAIADAKTYQEAYTALLARGFSRSLDRSRTQLEFLAAAPEVGNLPDLERIDPALHGIPEDADTAKRRLFRLFLEKHPEFSVLFVLTPAGTIYVTEPFEVQKRIVFSNLSGRAYFKQATQGRQTVLSDSFLGADGMRAVVIDVPVLDGESRIRAHVGGVLHIRSLSRFVEKSRIGPFTAGFVVDSNGTLIAHTDPDLLTPLGLSRFTEHPLMAPGPRGAGNPCAKPPAGTRIYEHPQAGEAYMGTLVPLANGWCFGLERRMREIEAPLFAEAWHTAALVAVLILGVSGLGLLLAHRVGRRWDQAESALRRARDKMEDQVRQRGAELIASNAALEREIAGHRAAQAELEAHRTRLEEIVAARTSDLRRANERLRAEVAERQRVEADLRLEQAHLRSLLANAPVILFATDRDGRFTLSEGRGLADMGLKAGQVVGLSVFDVYLDRPDVCALLRRALTGESFHSPVALGQLRYEVALAPLRDTSGAVDGVIGVATDITDRHRAEEALRRSEASLAKAQEIARLGSWEWDLKSNQMTWSTQLYRVLELDPAQAPPSYAAYLDSVHPDDRARVQAEVGRAAETGAVVALEHRIRTRQAGERAVDLRLEVRGNRSDRPERIFATVLDLQERKRAERELHEAAERLSLSNLNLLEFSYLVSHDLQEPLLTIVSFAEALKRNPAALTEPEGQAQLERILRTAVRMRELIQRMLELTRITTAAQDSVPVDLGQVVREVLSDLGGRLTAVGGQVEVGVLPVVAGDPLQMRQLFQNLIGNALKFHWPHSAPLVKVDLGEDNGLGPPPAGFCRIQVEDDGIGFDPSLGDKLFQPFQRLHGEGGYEGTGIGLALCKRIVERHGGTIEAASKPGRGARFTFTLPLAPPEA